MRQDVETKDEGAHWAGRFRALAWAVVRPPAVRASGAATAGHVRGVYRARNAARVAQLVEPLQARGWHVALWALDHPDPQLDAVTVGAGPGGRSELLNILTTGVVGPLVIVDDDVEFDVGDLSSFVDAAASLGLDVAQPAHAWVSRFSHVFTLSRPWHGARETTFVEIGPVVALSSRACELLLPLPLDTRMGWGTDVLWSDELRAGHLRGGIIDQLAIDHLGSVGAAYAEEEESSHVRRMLRERGVRHIIFLQRTLRRFRRPTLRPRSGDGSHRVAIGPVLVEDRTMEHIIAEVVDPPHLPYVAFAVHVGALALLDDRDYLDALLEADLAYADGHAIVHLAKTAGARLIERTPTTDIGYEVLRRIASRQRRVRVALVGGPAGLAERAGSALQHTCDGTEVVFVRDGFRPFAGADFEALRSSAPDVVFVGMGMPREAVWVHRHFDELPSSRIMTCGGWFGFVAGEERRAPRIVQRLRLEWSFRMIQSPRRLVGRYAFGLVRTLLMARRIRRERRRRP